MNDFRPPHDAEPMHVFSRQELRAKLPEVDRAEESVLLAHHGGYYMYNPLDPEATRKAFLARFDILEAADALTE